MIGQITVTVVRGTRDRYGDLGATTRHTVDGCVVVPGSSSEKYGDGSDQVTSALSVYAPPGADVTAQDAVTVPGYSGTWQVVGDPQTWPVPTAWRFGTEIHLVKIAG